MSQTGPNVFIDIGDTDWWDTTLRYADFRVDSRVRGARRSPDATTWASCCAGRLVLPKAGQRLYAELEWGVSNGTFFGVVPQGEETAMLPDYVGGTTNSVGTFATNIYKNSNFVQTGLTSIPGGARVGLELYWDSSTLKVQFYLEGVSRGTPVSLLSVPHRLAMACSTSLTASATLFVDAGELKYLPAGCQPWGTAARVSDAGGYSPAASVFGSAHADVTVDAFKKVITGSTTGRSALGNVFQTGSSAFRYVEFLSEAAGTDGHQLCGLGTANMSVSSYPGASINTGIGYSKNGSVFPSGVATGVTWTTNDRPGAIRHEATGKVWFTKNGVPVSGAPTALTGEHGTLAGPVAPASAPYTAGRVRLCSHAREQLHRPSYCEAWDGADLLPEQHYSGRLSSEAEVSHQAWFQPMGGSRSSGSPIGTVIWLNQDGAYDALQWYDLRDQQLSIAKRRADGFLKSFFKGICDSISLRSESAVELRGRGADALLDKRIDLPVTLVGRVAFMPVTPVQATALTYAVACTPYVKYELWDKGLVVSDWKRQTLSAAAGGAGFIRSVNPAGRQTAADVTAFRPFASNAIQNLLNAGFTTWTAGTPDNWSEAGAGGASVTQVGAAARFVGTTIDRARLWQTFTPTNGPAAYFLRVVVSAYVSGDLAVTVASVAYNASPTYHMLMRINGPGEYIVYAGAWGFSSPAVITLITSDATAADVTIDSVELIGCHNTGGTAQPAQPVLDNLLIELGGIAPNVVPTLPQYTNLPGYWSDQRPTLREVFDAFCSGWLYDYYSDENGRLKLITLSAPELETSVGAIVANDILDGVDVQDELLPALSDIGEYGRNYAVHSETDLAGAVSTTNRALLIAPFQTNRLTDATMQAFYRHAVGASALRRRDYSEVDNTLAGSPSELIDQGLINLANFTAKRRFRYHMSVRNAVADNYRLNDVVTVTYPRFDLAAGKAVKIVGARRRLFSDSTEFTVLG